MSPVQQQDDGSFTASCDECGRGELVGDADKAEFPSGEYATANEAVDAARRAGFEVSDEPHTTADGREVRAAMCADHVGSTSLGG